MPNITYIKIANESDETVWKYVIDKKKYSVNIKQYIPIFIDFGQSSIIKGKVHRVDQNNDAYMLLDAFKNYSYNSNTQRLCKTILSKITVQDDSRIKPRYVHVENIIHDFFKFFQIRNSDETKFNKVWKL